MLFVDIFLHPISCGRVLSKLRMVLEQLDMPSSKYNLHSLRVGSATDYALQGKSITEIKLLGRWAMHSSNTWGRTESVYRRIRFPLTFCWMIKCRGEGEGVGLFSYFYLSLFANILCSFCIWTRYWRNTQCIIWAIFFLYFDRNCGKAAHMLALYVWICYRVDI